MSLLETSRWFRDDGGAFRLELFQAERIQGTLQDLDAGSLDLMSSSFAAAGGTEEQSIVQNIGLINE